MRTGSRIQRRALRSGYSNSILNEDAQHNYEFNRGLITTTGIVPYGTRLIQDVWPLKVIENKTIKEGAHDGRPVMRVTGLFQECDKLNANHRIYPRSVLVKAVEQIQEDIARRSVLGELDHPSDAKIHLNSVSHLITKVWMDGQKVYGEAEILDKTIMGACLRGLFESKVQIGISSRGVGDMEMRESGGQETYVVSEGFAIVTWDAVAEPSVHGATLHVCESRVRSKLNSKYGNKYPQQVYNDMLVAEIKEYLKTR